MPQTSKKVLIFGYIGYGNAGDELILLSTLKSQSVLGGSITVLSADPEATTEKFGVRAAQARNLFSMLRETAAADIVISGGGGIFQDKTSSRSLWYYSFIVFLAKIFGKKLMLLHQGVGPLKTRLSRFLTRMAFSNIHRASVRDRESVELLENIGVDISGIAIAGDAVMDMVLARNIKNRKFKKVIFALRKWEGFENCARTITGVADGLRRRGILFEFLAFHPPLDNLTGMEIDLGGDVKKIIREISTADLVVGARFHSLVLAYLHGIPFIGINYDTKIENFCRRYRAPCVDIKGNEFKNKLEKSIMKVMKKAGK